MEIGVTLPAYGSDAHAVDPDLLRDWAQRAEAYGFDGLWAMDHLVQPDSYSLTVLDPLISLGMAAGVTDSIPLGTSILLAPIRQTPVIASQALSLQYLADREVTLGLGAGYVPEEFEVAGIDRRERGPRLSESIEVLQALFSGTTSYEGRFHSFEDVRIDPVLDSPPRLLAGGRSITVEGEDKRRFPDPMLDRIFSTAGWIAAPTSPTQLREEISLLRAAAEERGRDFSSVSRNLLAYVHVPRDDDQARAEQAHAFNSFYGGGQDFSHAQTHCVTGTPEEMRSQLDAYGELGIDHVILCPVTTPADGLAGQLDAFAREFL